MANVAIFIVFFIYVLPVILGFVFSLCAVVYEYKRGLKNSIIDYLNYLAIPIVPVLNWLWVGYGYTVWRRGL